MGLQRSGGDRTADVQPGGAPPRLKFKRAADGELKIDTPRPETHETVEPAEKPATPEDPRSANERAAPWLF